MHEGQGFYWEIAHLKLCQSQELGLKHQGES
jgi:hypothetical protein